MEILSGFTQKLHEITTKDLLIIHHNMPSHTATVTILVW